MDNDPIIGIPEASSVKEMDISGHDRSSSRGSFCGP